MQPLVAVAHTSATTDSIRRRAAWASLSVGMPGILPDQPGKLECVRESLVDWARVLAYVTGTVDQELLAPNECLAAENRVALLLHRHMRFWLARSCPSLRSPLRRSQA
jgi:hypothetical protein